MIATIPTIVAVGPAKYPIYLKIFDIFTVCSPFFVSNTIKP